MVISKVINSEISNWKYKGVEEEDGNRNEMERVVERKMEVETIILFTFKESLLAHTDPVK